METSVNSDWRTPSSSEADVIADWALKLRLNHSIAITKGTIVELVIAGVVGLSFCVGFMSVKGFLIFFGIFGVPALIWIISGILRDQRRHKKLLTGDYLIMDSFVISKSVSKGPYGSRPLVLFVKIPYGIERYFKVSSSVYNAVTDDAPGFLIRYDTKKPANQGTAKAFFPAIQVE